VCALEDPGRKLILEPAHDRLELVTCSSERGGRRDVLLAENEPHILVDGAYSLHRFEHRQHVRTGSSEDFSREGDLFNLVIYGGERRRDVVECLLGGFILERRSV